MRKNIFIALGALSVLIGMAVLAVAVAPNTPPGRSFLVSIAEKQLGAALGGEAEIGAIGGALPGKVRIENVTLNEDERIFARLARAELSWRPLALLRGRVVVDNLLIDGLEFLGPLPDVEKADDKAQKGFAFPETLPHVRVGNLQLRNGYVAKTVAGVDARFEGDGDLQIGDREIRANLDLISPDAGDKLEFSLWRNPQTDVLTVKARLQSPESGLAANLSRSDGPIDVHMSGAGPVTDYLLTISGVVGAYGAMTGEISGDLEARDAISVSLNHQFGDALEAITREVGQSVEAMMVMRPATEALTIDIVRLQADNLAANGVVSWRNDSKALKDSSLALNVILKDGYRAEIASLFGRAVAVEVAFSRRYDAYDLSASVAGDDATVRLVDATSDLSNALTGLLRVNLPAGGALPAPLNAGVAAEGQIDLVLDDRVTFTALTAQLPDGSNVFGEFFYRFADDNISANFDYSLSPQSIATIASNVGAQDAVTGAVTASGRVGDLAIDLDAKTPAADISGGTAGPATITANFKGIPSTPTGEFRATGAGGERMLAARLQPAGDGAYHLHNINFSGPEFQLGGEALVNPRTRTGTVDIVYDGERGAEPYPGVVIEGDFSVIGEIPAEGAESGLLIVSDALTVADFSLDNFSLKTTGPVDAMAIAFSIAGASTPAATIMSVEGVAELDAIKNKSLHVTDLAASVDSIELALKQAMRIGFADGLVIEGFDARFGAGDLALDAVLAPQFWQGSLEASDVRLPGSGVALTASIDLDTNRSAMASGDFDAVSVLTNNENARIAGAFTWDGTTFAVNNRSDVDGLDFSVAIPARLTRGESLGVELEGALSGKVRYAGAIAPIAAFMPPTMQSLEGALEVAATLGGEVSAPEVVGTATVSDGAFTDLASGLSIVGIELQANARSAASSSIVDFTLSARGPDQTSDTILGRGDIVLGEASLVDLSVSLDGARFSAGPVESVAADGSLTIAGALDAPKIDGAFTISELNAEAKPPPSTGLVAVDVVTQHGSAAPEAPPPAAAPAIPVNLSIAAKDKLFVRGRGLESEWAADVQITGAADDPRVLGTMNIRRGWLDFAGRRFAIVNGEIVFDRLVQNTPLIDIRAEVEASDLVAAIIVKGRADAVNIGLESTPSLPQNDILAYVLFGEPMNDLTAFEALQVTQALAQLGAIDPFGGSGLTSSARSALGLDLLNVDTDGENGASLTVGKYVADGLFVSATQDAKGEQGSVRVEYEITDNFTVETQLRQNGDQAVSANWKRDF